MPGITAEQQGFRGLGVVHVRVVEAQQHIALLEQGLHGAVIGGVGPGLADDFQPQVLRRLAQFFQEESTVTPVQHANTHGLG
ncbi:hypothetical protein D3C78_1893690 [compost metagenome]